MWDIVKEILTSPVGSFGFVVGVLYLIGWSIYKVTKATTLMSEKMKCVTKMETSIDTIKGDIQVIKAHLSAMQSGKVSLVKSCSPMGLTPAGEKTAKKMEISGMIARNWDKISAFIDNHTSDKSTYDIQQFCVEAATVNLEQLFDSDDLKRIKSFAYHEGMPLAYYSGMIGILIRDRYFQTKGM